MAKLNQIIAVANGRKGKTQKALTEVYHKCQKPTMFEGINRTYKPDADDGETFPPENKNVQYTVTDALKEAQETLTELFDVVATQDWANCLAKADVVVDGQTILTAVPVTYLLFLEKQLTDIGTFVQKLPTLDPAETWSFNEANASYSSAPARTTKSKKVMRNHVKAQATEHHPAQVDTYTEDVKVGEWSTIKFSGAIPSTRRNELLERVARLSDAVKYAREQANGTEVQDISVGSPVFKYLFR